VSTVTFAAEKVTYDDQVLPIFRNACNNCHNPDKKKAGLDLTTYQGALQGSENGKVVQSGNTGGSLLLKCVKQTDDPKMPPKGDKLNDQEIALIEKWIAGQLLENATGKAVAAADNKVTVAVVSLTRPDGPPPLPGDLSLEPVLRTTKTNTLTAMAVSPWAPVVALGGQKQILLYHTETYEPLGVLPFPEGFPTILRFSRNGQLLLTGGGLGGKSGKVVIWDIATGDRVATIGNEVDQVLAADLSPDQQFVALGGPTRLVKIYATKSGRLVASIKKHTDWVTAIAYSPDGKFLASADRNGGIQVWEGSTGREFNSLPGHKTAVTGLAFMPGVLASSSEDGKIALWDVKEGKEIRSWAAHAGGVAWVDFTPDGRLVSCGRDKLAKAWDQDGKPLGKTEPFGDITLRAGLSGDRVIAGDWSGVVRVSTLAGKQLAQLSTNPPTLADRLAETNRRLADLQAALPGLEQGFSAASEKVKTEKEAAEANAEPAKEAKAGAPSESEQAVAKAKVALDEATAQLAATRAQFDRWTLAQLFQTVHGARLTLAQKQAARDELADTAKNGAQPIERIRAEIVAAEKSAADAVAQLPEKERLLAAAEQAVTPANQAIGAAEAALTEREKTLKTILAAAPQSALTKVNELTARLTQQTDELAKLREARGNQPQGTPEFAEANKLVQDKKAEIATTQTALDAAKSEPAVDTPEARAAVAEIGKAREALDQVRAAAREAGEKLSLAAREASQAKAAVEQSEKQLAELKAKEPEIVKAAQLAMADAERMLPNAEQELAAAKLEAERMRTVYESARAGATRVIEPL
jgi:hypothetical protein